MEAGKMDAASCAAHGIDVEMTVSEVMLKATKEMERETEVAASGKEKLEANDAFAKRLEAELKPENETLWRLCVEYSPAAASAFDAGLTTVPGVLPGNGSARALVRVHAVAAAKRLLDVWAETTMGRTWDDFLQMTQLETEAEVLEEVIEPGQPEVVRAKTLAFLRAHETLYGKADTPVKVKLAVSGLLNKLDKSMVATAPGKTEAARLLTTSKEALADAMSDAADKAARATPQDADETVAPTEEMREPQQREREERPTRSRERIRYVCHKEEQFARERRQKKAAGGKQDKAEAKEKAHRLQDCPKKGNKNAPSKYSSDEGESKDTPAGATEETLTTEKRQTQCRQRRCCWSRVSWTAKRRGSGWTHSLERAW